MALPSGYNVRAAVKRPTEASAWGTAIATATQQIPIISESMTNAPVLDLKTSLIGTAAEQDQEIVAWNVKGTISTELWFEGLEYLWYAALGFECPTVWTGAYGSGSGGSPAYDTASNPDGFVHFFELDDDLHRVDWAAGERAATNGSDPDPDYWEGGTDQKVRCFDLYIDKLIPAAYVHEFHNCMVTKVTLNVAQDGVRLDWDLIAYKHEQDSDGNRDNWALPSYTRKATFPMAEFRLGTLGASEPATMNIQSMTLSIENPMQEDFEVDSSGNPVYVSEPIRNNSRRVSGEIKLARFLNTNAIGYVTAETDLQSILRFTTDDAISGTSSWYPQIEFVMPLMRMISAEFPVAGPGVITGDLSFSCHPPASNQTWQDTLQGGMTQVKDSELQVFLTNSIEACVARDRQTSGVTLP